MPQNNYLTELAMSTQDRVANRVNNSIGNMRDKIQDFEEHAKLIDKKYYEIKDALNKVLEDINKDMATYNNIIKTRFPDFEKWLSSYVDDLLEEAAEKHKKIKEYLLLDGRTMGSNKKEAEALCKELSISPSCADEMEVARCGVLGAIRTKKGGKNAAKCIDKNDRNLKDFRNAMIEVLKDKNLYK